ncbi:MAG TPA: hypothetical protein VFM88_12210 [Vicinamibacteria bacterium]|nr:hypothetical protein [Vicinamibacteria bacterium]
MSDFSRLAECGMCGRHYVVSGFALNPGAETQAALYFKCVCGAEVEAFLPGSANRELVKVDPAGQ